MRSHLAPARANTRGAAARSAFRGRDSVGGIPRYARADFEIDGVAIQDGDLLLLDIGSANHGPSMFSNPDRADISRKHAAHLTFGHGAHYYIYIGAPLARIELKRCLRR